MGTPDRKLPLWGIAKEMSFVDQGLCQHLHERPSESYRPPGAGQQRQPVAAFLPLVAAFPLGLQGGDSGQAICPAAVAVQFSTTWDQGLPYGAAGDNTHARTASVGERVITRKRVQLARGDEPQAADYRLTDAYRTVIARDCALASASVPRAGSDAPEAESHHASPRLARLTAAEPRALQSLASAAGGPGCGQR